MEEDRASHLQHILEGRKQMLEVMAVDRTGIAESQFFEEQPWEDGALGQFFGSTGQLLTSNPICGIFLSNCPVSSRIPV